MGFRLFTGGPLGMFSKMNDLLRKKLGADGEQIAVGFLRKRGLRILNQNLDRAEAKIQQLQAHIDAAAASASPQD